MFPKHPQQHHLSFLLKLLTLTLIFPLKFSSFFRSCPFITHVNTYLQAIGIGQRLQPSSTLLANSQPQNLTTKSQFSGFELDINFFLNLFFSTPPVIHTWGQMNFTLVSTTQTKTRQQNKAHTSPGFSSSQLSQHRFDEKHTAQKSKNLKQNLENSRQRGFIEIEKRRQLPECRK